MKVAKENINNYQNKNIENEEKPYRIVTAKKIGKSKVTVKSESGVSTIVEIANLIIEYTPTNATDKTIKKWKSSDEKIAKIDSNGKVTAIRGGIATITVKTEICKTASCSVK